MKNTLPPFLLTVLWLSAAPALWAQAESAESTDRVEIQLPGNSVHEVLDFYERLTGKRLVRDAELTGPNLTLVVPGKVSRPDAVALVESALLLNGYTLVPVDEATVKVLGTGKSPLGEGVPLYADAAALPSGEQMVSYFMLLRYIPAKDAMAVFEKYVSVRKQGSIVAVPNSNAIVISDNTPLIRRLIDLQRLIDVPGAKIVTEFVTLTRADAERVAETVNRILDQEKKDGERGAVQVTIGNSNPAEMAALPQVTTPAQTPLSSASSFVQVVADVRTNRVLVVAAESRLAYIKKLITDLDIAVDLDQPLERPLKFVSAGDVLPVLQSILAEGGGAIDPNVSPANATPQIQGAEDTFAESPGTAAGGKPDKLRAPRESTAPLAVSVGKARIIADRSANKIIVIGPPESRTKAAHVLDMLDQKPKQVYLATVIGQLTLGDGLEVGVDYLVKFKGSNGNGIGGLLRTRVPGTDVLPDPSSLLTNVAFPVLSGLTVYGTIAETVDIYAKALATTNRFKVLSRPVVYTANNKKATISSGQSVPIPVSTLTSAISTSIGDNPDTGTALASNIQYKDVVLKLEVIPLVNSNDEVTLTIAQQNDSLQDSVTVSNNQVPVIGTQELTTTITVKNRQTVVLGGLITEEKQDLKTGIPLIGDIPGLGYFFSTTRKQTTRRELIILIQPLIVANDADQAEASYIEKSMSGLNGEFYEDRIEVRKALPVTAGQRPPPNWNSRP